MKRAWWLAAGALLYSLGFTQPFPDWQHSQKISVDTRGLGLAGQVAAFPLLVRLNADNFDFNKAREGGDDLRFVSANGTTLYHSVQTWDAVKREANVWVRADAIYPDTITTFQLFIDKDGASSTASPGNVWINHRAAWHLDGYGGMFGDASTNGQTAVLNEFLDPGEGVVGDAVYIDQVDDTTFLHLGEFDADLEPNGFTYSAWMKMDTAWSNSSFLSVDGDNWKFSLERSGQSNDAQVNAGDSGAAYFTGLQTGVWQHIAITRDPASAGDSLRVYVNGAPVDVYNAGLLHGNLYDASWELRVGRIGTSDSGWFEGYIDEPRFSHARSADWILLSYATQKPGSATVRYQDLGTSLRLSGPAIDSLDGGGNAFRFEADLQADFRNGIEMRFEGESASDTYLRDANVRSGGMFLSTKDSVHGQPGALRNTAEYRASGSKIRQVHPTGSVTEVVTEPTYGSMYSTYTNEADVSANDQTQVMPSGINTTGDITAQSLSSAWVATDSVDAGVIVSRGGTGGYQDTARLHSGAIEFRSSGTSDSYVIQIGGPAGIVARSFGPGYGPLNHHSSIAPEAIYTTGELNAANMYAGSLQVSGDIVSTGNVQATSITATEVVTTPAWEVVPDYVFEKDYKRRSLAETERFVKQNKHLPDMPSARHIADKGMSLTDMNLRLLKTVEELTLHVIDLDKEVKSLKQKSRKASSH